MLWFLIGFGANAQVRCLNEAVDDSAKGIFRAWDKRLDSDAEPLESNEDDPELLLHIPFDGAVKLKAICIIGERAMAKQKDVAYWQSDECASHA